MSNTGEPGMRARVRGRLGTLGLVALAAAFVAAIFAGSVAHAAPNLSQQAAGSGCTPPTNPYGSATTIADCNTTTTAAQATLTLSVSYQSGHLTWKVCVEASAVGSSVQIYLNGQQVDSSQVAASGCTPTNNLAICLASGTYTATAVDQPYGETSQSFTVQESGCSNPTSLTASAGQSGSGAGNSGSGAASGGAHQGALAFTGADIALLVIGAAALMTIGYGIVRTTRRRRPAS